MKAIPVYKCLKCKKKYPPDQLPDMSELVNGDWEYLCPDCSGFLVWNLEYEEPPIHLTKEIVHRRTYTLPASSYVERKQILRDMDAQGFELIRDYETWSKPQDESRPKLVDKLIFEKFIEE